MVLKLVIKYTLMGIISSIITGGFPIAGSGAEKGHAKQNFNKDELLEGIDVKWIKGKFTDFELPSLPQVPTGPIVKVGPGEDIQQEINELAKEAGGVVRLLKGKHYIPETIRLRSNIILEGEGSESIMTRREEDKINRMIYTGGGLRNVVIRNLTIDGARSREDRGTDDWTWPRGVDILDSDGGRNKRVFITGVHIRRTSHGFHSKGTDDLIIKHVEFYDNGCYFAYVHNLYLRRNNRVIIRDSRFADSHTGNGINLTRQHNIIVKNNELSNNAFRGLRAARTKNIVIDGNVAIGNGRFGIGTRSEGGGSIFTS